MTRRVAGWRFGCAIRRELLRRFPPRYPNVVADHVTFKPGPGMAEPADCEAAVVGHADDGLGVEALVVAVAGSTDRPDGSTWHITWSLAAGRTAGESNDIIAASGWHRLDDPLPIALIASEWEWHD